MTNADLAVIRFSDAQLAAIDNFGSAMAMFNGPVESVKDYGSGFVLISKDEKARLVGVDFLAVKWEFHESADYMDAQGLPAEFVSVYAVTVNNDKVIFNDGSTGIARQLRDITDRRTAAGRKDETAGLLVKGGLTVSEYTTEVGGKPTKATTYYLSER